MRRHREARSLRLGAAPRSSATSSGRRRPPRSATTGTSNEPVTHHPCSPTTRSRYRTACSTSSPQQTGITVKVLQAGDAGAMVNQAILTKDKPQGDVLFGVDNTFLVARARQRALRAVRVAGAERRRPAVRRPDRATARSRRSTTATCASTTTRPGSRRTSSPRPTTLDDLTKPAYKDLLVVENPATSSPGLAFLLATIAQYGDDGWQDYWKQLRANGVEVVDGWDAGVRHRLLRQRRARAPKPLVVSYASSPPAEVVFAEPPPTDAPTGRRSTSSCFRQIEFAGVLQGTKHAAAAGKLVDFLLSTTFQDDMPLNMFVYPVRPTADAARRVREVRGRARRTPLSLPPDEIAEQPRRVDRRVDVDRAAVDRAGAAAAGVAAPRVVPRRVPRRCSSSGRSPAILGAGPVGADGSSRRASPTPASARVAWFTLWQATVSTVLTLLSRLPGAYVLSRATTSPAGDRAAPS